MSEPKATPELDVTVPASIDAQTNPSSLRGLHGRNSLEVTLDAETLAGRYELLALLGSGGMGAVYKARDLELGELVALKMLRPELCADAGMISRFRQEVKLARRVTHQNVARTYDIGEHGPQRFLTMELIVGASLADVMRREAPLSITRVVEIASAICAGLGAAHAAGVVHRDLKPDNVLLGDDGRIVVTDFGIARVVDPAAHEAVKTIGMPLGTPAYMAPEQVEGSPDVDARADIYAFGTMLYELFTGARAWTGDSVFWIASRRLIEPPPDPRLVRPDVPAAAAEVVLRCMARFPADRFQKAEDVIGALAAITPAPAVSSASPSGVVRTLSGAAAAVAMKSVAVLPFRNAGDVADEYLAEGLTDDLIDVLSMTPGLRVCARGVVMARAAGARDPRDIGRDLTVDVVVEGSLRRSADRLRVTARVVSVADGFQLWAQRFDRSETAFFEVNDAVARAVAEALTCKVEQAPREPATDPIALDLYLRARHEYFKYWRDNAVKASELFEQALARAPNDPMILAGYAMALTRLMGQDDGTDEHAEGARRAAEKALSIAPHSASARTALAQEHLLSGRAPEAAREVRAVLDGYPASPDALELAGRMLVECGPPSEAIHRLERALELEPNAVTVKLEIAKVYALQGDSAATDAFFGEEPEHPGLSNIYWINRCRAALWLGEADRARPWRTLLEARPGVAPGVLMMLRSLTGDPPTNEQLLAVLDVASSGTRLLKRRALYAQLVCEFAAFFGRTDVALGALERADTGYLFDAIWIERCAPLALLRAEPRFLAVRERVLARAGEVRAGLGVT